MFDPITLATAAVAALSPYFVAGAKKFAEKAGEEAFEGSRKLLTWLRGNLSKEKDGDLEKALNRLEADPGSADKAAALRVSLTEFLTANPGLQSQLKSLLPSPGQVAASQIASTIGDNNTTIQT